MFDFLVLRSGGGGTYVWYKPENARKKMETNLAFVFYSAFGLSGIRRLIKNFKAKYIF